MSIKHIKFEEKYRKEVIPALKEKLGINNDFSVPRIIKVIVSSGVGRKLLSTEQGKARTALQDQFKEDLKLITGQMPVVAKAKKSIASFKSRSGMVIGLKVSLRGKKMYDFLDRINSYVLPRVRDFRGLSLKNIDSQGNLNIGFKDMMVFPEVPPTSSKNIFGLQVTIVTSSKDREQAKELFYMLGFPLKKEEEKKKKK